MIVAPRCARQLTTSYTCQIVGSRDSLEAERSFRKAIEIARQPSSVSLELRATLSLHAVGTDGENKQAKSEITRLLSLIMGGGETPDVAEARRVAEGCTKSAL